MQVPGNIESMTTDTPRPPRPGHYTVSYVHDSDSGLPSSVTPVVMTCNLCGQPWSSYTVTIGDLGPDRADYIDSLVTLHHAREHRDRLYVSTSAGWFQYGQLTAPAAQPAAIPPAVTGADTEPLHVIPG